MPAFLGGIATNPKFLQFLICKFFLLKVEMPAFLGGIATGINPLYLITFNNVIVLKCLLF